jgi:hypothetical protein
MNLQGVHIAKANGCHYQPNYINNKDELKNLDNT